MRTFLSKPPRPPPPRPPPPRGGRPAPAPRPPPPYLTVCRRHRLWIGPSARTHAGQADVSPFPEILRAQRRPPRPAAPLPLAARRRLHHRRHPHHLPSP